MRSLIAHIVVAGLLLWVALPAVPDGAVRILPTGWESPRQIHFSHP